MSAFTTDELAYLREERRLTHVATVGQDGTPHVVPGGYAYNPEHDTIVHGPRARTSAPCSAMRQAASSPSRSWVAEPALSPHRPTAGEPLPVRLIRVSSSGP
jgi:pyridoxamine 5'-phosphate oxidase family protein